MARGLYTVTARRQTVSTAITVLQYTAPATATVEVMRAWASVQGATTPISAALQMLRKTATITGTASPPALIALGGDQAAGGTVAWLATAEGTDGNIEWEDDLQYLQSPGWLFLPSREEERVYVPPSGIIALKFPAAPTSGVMTFGFALKEIG